MLLEFFCVYVFCDKMIDLRFRKIFFIPRFTRGYTVTFLFSSVGEVLCVWYGVVLRGEVNVCVQSLLNGVYVCL